MCQWLWKMPLPIHSLYAQRKRSGCPKSPHTWLLVPNELSHLEHFFFLFFFFVTRSRKKYAQNCGYEVQVNVQPMLAGCSKGYKLHCSCHGTWTGARKGLTWRDLVLLLGPEWSNEKKMLQVRVTPGLPWRQQPASLPFQPLGTGHFIASSPPLPVKPWSLSIQLLL